VIIVLCIGEINSFFLCLQNSIPCYIVTPIVTVGVFFRYDIGASVTHINIESSCEAHYLFDKMPLTTKFSYDNLKSLLCGIKIHASFVHDEISRSSAMGRIMFHLNEKLGVVTFDCRLMELRMMWLITIDVASTYGDLVLRHFVDECNWLLGRRSRQFVYLHFAKVEYFVLNFIGWFIVSGSDQTHGYNFCTPILLASILTTCRTHLFSHHVLEAATNCFIRCCKLICISRDIVIVSFLGDGSLMVVQKLKCVNVEGIMKVISQVKVLLTVPINVINRAPTYVPSIYGWIVFNISKNRLIEWEQLLSKVTHYVGGYVGVTNDLKSDILTLLADIVLILPMFKLIKVITILGLLCDGVVLNHFDWINKLKILKLSLNGEAFLCILECIHTFP